MQFSIYLSICVHIFIFKRNICIFIAHEVRPEDIGLITIKGDEETQPFMVAFLKATNHIKAKKRRRRDVERGRKFDYTTVMKNQHQGI